MTDKQTIAQLEVLKEYCEAEAKNSNVAENIWASDVKALENAIECLKERI